DLFPRQRVSLPVGRGETANPVGEVEDVVAPGPPGGHLHVEVGRGRLRKGRADLPEMMLRRGQVDRIINMGLGRCRSEQCSRGKIFPLSEHRAPNSFCEAVVTSCGKSEMADRRTTVASPGPCTERSV